MRQRIAALVLAAGLAATGLLIVGSPANAATVEASCGVGYGNGDACFWFQDNLSGSEVGVENAYIPDVESPWISFLSSGAGKGLGIGNDAGSELNGDLTYDLVIWIHHNYTGSYDVLPPGTWIGHGDGITINNERSYSFD